MVADRMDDEKAEVDVGAGDEVLVVGSELVVLLLIVVEVVLGVELAAIVIDSNEVSAVFVEDPEPVALALAEPLTTGDSPPTAPS